MIRVLHYGMSPNLGGIETYLLNLVRGLGQDIHSDFLYSDSGKPPVFAKELEPLGSRFFGVTPRRANPLLNRRDLTDLFGRHPFDILHFHANTTSYVEPVRAALRHGVRVVYHSHNAGASRSRMTRALHAWHRATLPWNRITRLAVSEEAGRWMFSGQPFQVIHNGIDIDAFAFQPKARESARATWGVGPDTLIVGQIGAFLPAKNHHFTLDVFAELLHERPDALLVLIGDGPGEQKVRDRVASLGLAGRVRFLGRRSDMPALLAGMDAMIMPSLHEGFGLVALEAQASGLPCLLSDAITAEVVVSPTCHRLPLTASACEWAARISAGRVDDRSQGQGFVRRAGYTAQANANAIGELYRHVVQPTSSSR